jgi:hypothetical protein
MTALLSIGELSARTGLPVRTIRFYSDSGVVPPAERSAGGYRLYGPDALARLGLVRTLRDLGSGLARGGGGRAEILAAFGETDRRAPAER